LTASLIHRVVLSDSQNVSTGFRAKIAKIAEMSTSEKQDGVLEFA